MTTAAAAAAADSDGVALDTEALEVSITCM